MYHSSGRCSTGTVQACWTHFRGVTSFHRVLFLCFIMRRHLNIDAIKTVVISLIFIWLLFSPSNVVGLVVCFVGPMTKSIIYLYLVPCIWLDEKKHTLPCCDCDALEIFDWLDFCCECPLLWALHSHMKFALILIQFLCLTTGGSCELSSKTWWNHGFNLQEKRWMYWRTGSDRKKNPAWEELDSLELIQLLIFC